MESPLLSKIIAQLAVDTSFEILLEAVADGGRVLRRKSPFESFPNAEINETDPFNLKSPSARFRPTPPAESVVFALYVAPFSCKVENKILDKSHWYDVNPFPHENGKL